MTKKIIRNKHLSRPVPDRVPAAVARDLLRLVGKFGDDPAHFLRDAELPHLISMLTGANSEGGTVSRGDFAQLYAHCTLSLDARAAQQEGRKPLTKSGFDMMCYCVITCHSLRDVITRMDQFAVLLAPRTARLTLDVTGGVARLDMATVRQVHNACAYLSDLTGLATYSRLFGWLIGEDIPLLATALRYPAMLETQTISYLMPHAVEHRAPQNSLRFPARYLDRPVIRNHHELALLLARFPFDVHQAQSKTAPLSERISHLFASMLASGNPPSTAAYLAQQFSISVATLKRRLAAENTSLAQLKASARFDLAAQLLHDPRLTIAEIGRRTHFSDTSAFHRAFRHWTGTSPSRWRKRLDD